MSQELRVNLSSTLTNGQFSDQTGELRFVFDQAAVGAWMPIVSVGTSEEDMAVVDITTNGWLFIKNLDGTNYVQWGPKSGGVMVPVGRIKAGEFAMMRLDPGVTLRWIANTAAVKVQVKLYEN